MEVAVSYTRKLNSALYGGNQYESSNFFASMKTEVPDDTDPTTAYRDMRAQCKDMVDEAVETEIMQISGGIPKADWDRFLQDVVAGRGWGTTEQYDAMSPYQKNIAQMLKRAHKRENYQHRNK